MRQKLNQIHKNLRKEMKEEYFRQRRAELLLYREREALEEKERRGGTSFDRYGWRGVALEREKGMDVEEREERTGKRGEVEFEIVLRRVQDGQYYLNMILEQAGLRCFEATINLLSQLITKLLNPTHPCDYLETKTQTNLVYMILTHAHNLLQANSNPSLRRSKKQRRHLCNLFATDYRRLLNLDDPIIVNHLIDIAQMVCNEYDIPPNYELVKYILLRITTKENLQGGEGQQRTLQKMQHLLLKFIIHCRLQEKSNFKEMNVPYQQIIYDYNTYIEFNLMNLYDFVKSHRYPFHYGFLNQSLSFILTLQVHIVKRFRAQLQGNREAGGLVKGSVISLIEKIIVAKQEKEVGGGQMDEISMVLEETVTVILWYLIDCKIQRNQRNRSAQEHQESAILTQSTPLLTLILLAKVKLRQICPD